MQPTERTVVDAHGLDHAALRDGVEWLIAEAGDGGRGGIVFPNDAQAETLAHVLPEPIAETLIEHGEATIKDGPVLQLFDRHTLSHTAYAGPILAVWADDALLTEIDQLHPSAIRAIPWESVDVQGWAHGWGIDEG